MGEQLQIVWSTAAWFLAAAILLDLFDISLPRGDAMGVGGALASGALLILGPIPAVIVSLLALVLAHVMRRRLSSPRRLLTAMAARGFGLVVGALEVWYLASLPTWDGEQFVVALLVPASFLIVELVVAQVVTSVGTGRPLGRLLAGNARLQAPLLFAQWSASVFLIITFDGMGVWSLIPVVVLLLLMRQSYALLLDVRETYRTTVEVIVEAAEAEDPRRVGHAERTASIARSIGMKLGMDMTAVERLSYAALLHDVEVLSERTYTAGATTDPLHDTHTVQAMFGEVEFFSDILPILRVCAGERPDDGVETNDSDLLAAMIVALSSDVDSLAMPAVAQVHRAGGVERVAPLVSRSTKAAAVAAALELGYRIPAVP